MSLFQNTELNLKYNNKNNTIKNNSTITQEARLNKSTNIIGLCHLPSPNNLITMASHNSPKKVTTQVTSEPNFPTNTQNNIKNKKTIHI